MPERLDLADIWNKAWERTLPLLTERDKGIRGQIDKPIGNFGVIPKEERVAQARMWLTEPMLVSAGHREAATRFKVQPREDGPAFSKRYVKMIVDYFKELQEAENGMGPTHTVTG